MTTGATNQFDSLVGELGDLLKAATAEKDGKGDETIKKAAEDGEEGGEDGGEDEDEGESFGKAFSVTLPDGTVQEAYDGTVMLKALHTENLGLRADLGRAGEALTGAVGVIRAMQKTQGEQGTLLKSLSAQVAAMGTQGAGRRAVLSINDKPGAGSGGGGAKVTAGDVMAKSMALFTEGKLTGADIARVEAAHGRGQLGPADVLHALGIQG